MGLRGVVINLRTVVNNNSYAVRNVLAKERCYYLTENLLDVTFKERKHISDDRPFSMDSYAFLPCDRWLDV